MTEAARERRRGSGSVSYRATAWLAWSVWALCVALLTLAAMLDYIYTPPFPNRGIGEDVYRFLALPLLVYATVGAFVASRRSGNLVGWLLCVMGLVVAVQGFSVTYADYALLGAPPFPLPGGVYMACVSQTLGVLAVVITAAALMILLFPDGRLPDRNFRAVPWVIVGGGATSALWALTSEAVFDRYSVPNPLWAGGVLGDAVEGFGRLGMVTCLITLVVAIIAVFVRLGSARGVERQQLKWFAYAAALLLGLVIATPWIVWVVPGWLGLPLLITGLSAIPVAVGSAVLRYQLYDIDRIVNRTLVYGSLTVMLATVYFGVVTATQVLFPTLTAALTGRERLPELVVVATTLVVAALFNPLRQRIQSFIDRIFYRRRYDAAMTLEGFSAKLRDETDLDTLKDDLLGAVRETVQPAHVSLWLRSGAAPKGERAD